MFLFTFLFFYASSFSPWWPLALIFSPQLQNFHVVLPAENVSFVFLFVLFVYLYFSYFLWFFLSQKCICLISVDRFVSRFALESSQVLDHFSEMYRQSFYCRFHILTITSYLARGGSMISLDTTESEREMRQSSSMLPSLPPPPLSRWDRGRGFKELVAALNQKKTIYLHCKSRHRVIRTISVDIDVWDTSCAGKVCRLQMCIITLWLLVFREEARCCFLLQLHQFPTP